MRWKWDTEKLVKERISKEKGSPYSEGKNQMALLYPAPYRVGMASLGFLHVFKTINARPDWKCERFFIESENKELFDHKSYETRTRLREFPVIAISISYEGEIYSLISYLEESGISSMRQMRTQSDPLIIAGGPLTEVSPELLEPVADIIFLGESENTLDKFLEIAEQSSSEPEIIEKSALISGVWVPEIHLTKPHNALPADVSQLPAYSFFTSPEAEFGSRVLIETERGCSRRCSFCVMSRIARGYGMRIVPFFKLKEILNPVPEAVGLVGAAVTDHPETLRLLEHLVSSGSNVSLSSMRADRLDYELLKLLYKGGLRTLTVAADAPSERIRIKINKGIKASHLLNAAEYARKAGIKRMKLYQIIGYPDETNEDTAELIELAKELSGIIRLDISLNPLVPKKNTPLSKTDFIDRKTFNSKLNIIKRAFSGKIGLQISPWKEAAWEYHLHKKGMKAVKILYEGIKQGETKASIRKKVINS